MKTGYKVSDAMTQEPICVAPDDNVISCASKMKQFKVGGMVVKQGNKLVGICTEQDFVHNLVAENKNPNDFKVKDIMCSTVRTIEPDKDIFEAIMKMRDLNVRRLPVVSNNELVGIITMKDIVKIEPQLFDLLVDKIEIREEETKPIKIKTADEEVDDIISK
jgi:CBS domain-containing protein